MIAALTRTLGVHNLGLAEDAVQDAFCRAATIWASNGLPKNPSAWLIATATNGALDILRRQRTALIFAPELGRHLDCQTDLTMVRGMVSTPDAIPDDALRVMFWCCHPGLPEPAQIMLILRVLCGLSIGEIAIAFNGSRAAIEKRLMRAKQVLAASKKSLFQALEPDQITTRLPTVHRAIHLMFNEGCHGAGANGDVRVERCREAMRLTALLLEHPFAASPATYALAAIMGLETARLIVRDDQTSDLMSLFDQDGPRPDPLLMVQGLRLLRLSAAGDRQTHFRVNAVFASFEAETMPPRPPDWPDIIALYDKLGAVWPSPVVALNRAIAVAQNAGPERGLTEVRALTDVDRLAGYPFYAAALGELEYRCGRPVAAREHFQLARSLSRSPIEHRRFDQRVRRNRHGGAVAAGQG